MHQQNGTGANALVIRRSQGGNKALIQLQRHQHLALGAQPFLHFHNPLVQHLRQDDLASKDIRAVLVANAQRILEALRHDEDNAIALAFQQSVGGDGRAHLHHRHLVSGHRLIRCKAKDFANALHRCVLVAFGIFRQQLAGSDAPVWMIGDDVGKGAASIEPKLPAVRGRCHRESKRKGAIAPSRVSA